jgi:hypothetical protein
MSEKKAAEEKPSNGTDPGALEAAFQRTLSSGHGIPRRKATFRVSYEDCSPNTFTEDFDITIGALTSALELRASALAKGDSTALALHMARLSVIAINGTTIDPASTKGEWFWDAIGQRGRMLVVSMFGELGAPGEEALGKARQTLRIE